VSIHGAEAASAPSLIRGARVFDGQDWRGECDVLVDGGLVAEVSAVGAVSPPPDVVTVDGAGLVLAPGFIDIHGMDRGAAAMAGKDAVNYLSQGVTTVVVGNCGVGTPDGAAPDLAVNVVELAGHNAAHRAATHGDGNVLDWLRARLERGARGVSLGLMYEPGRSASAAELRAVADLVADQGGVLAVHMRDEGAGFVDSISEILAIRGRAAVVIMHLKACGEQNWPLLDRGRELLRREGVQWTYYPYTDPNTRLAAAVPFPFDSASSLREMLQEPSLYQRFRDSGLQTLARRGWDGVIITQGPEPLIGTSVGAVARSRAMEPESAVAALLSEDMNIRARFVEVADLAGLQVSARDELAMAASDAYLFDSSAMNPEHPRNFGAIARSLQWARDGGYIENFLSGVTSRAADLYSLPRGRIEVGATADLVLLDVPDVHDRASDELPGLTATGVSTVWITGRVVYADGMPAKLRSGSVL
jgi:N-acyl-D-amino-acid deacylase